MNNLEVLLLPEESKTAKTTLVEYKAELKNWKPSNKNQATAMLHSLSILNAAEKSIKTAAYNFLNGKCNGCETMVGGNGLTVKKVNKTKKVHNTSDKLEALELELARIKKEIEAEKVLAGHEVVPSTTYWLAVD